MPHGGHEAEDRRRPARGDQGGPGHRHARPPRGWRPAGGRDVRHEAGELGDALKAVAALRRRHPRLSHGGTAGRARDAAVPGPRRVLAAPHRHGRSRRRWVAWRRDCSAAVDRARRRVPPANRWPDSGGRPRSWHWPSPRSAAPEPGRAGHAPSRPSSGSTCGAVLAAEKATGRAGEITRLPVPPGGGRARARRARRRRARQSAGLRRAGAALARAARGRDRVVTDLAAPSRDDGRTGRRVRAAVEGLLLGGWSPPASGLKDRSDARPAAEILLDPALPAGRRRARPGARAPPRCVPVCSRPPPRT